MAEHRGVQAPASSDPQERGGFLGFVAHEMRNPLSTALWSSELLARLSSEDRAGPRGDKLAGMCLRALQKLRCLVEDHFLAERLDVSGIPLRREAVVLRDAVAAAAAKLGLTDTGLEIPADLAVWVDRGLLERALDGILAVSRRGASQVRVEGVQSRDAALVRVIGDPPPPDALDPPQKGTASDPSGRALALHMAVRVAAALGGSLSTAPDGYLLELPLVPASPNAGHD